MSVTIQKKLKNLDLPRSEKQVAVAMAGHLWEKNPAKGTWIGIEKIAAECSMSERTVFRAISELKKRRIVRLIGHRKGVRANMPIYTFHPESGQVLSLFTPEEPATLSGSKSTKNLPNTAEEPANCAKNLTPCQEEPDTMSPDKGLKLYEKERASTTPDPSSYFVWLLSAYSGLNLSGKEKTTVRAVVQQGTYDLSVLKSATGRVLDPIDVCNTFDRAGDKLATNLGTQCEAVLLDQRKARQTAELVRVGMENERQKVAEEQAEVARREAEEAALIEESLDDISKW